MTKRYKIPVFIFIAIYLCVVLCVFRDYGISWDKHSSRAKGITAWEYVATGDRALFEE